MHNHPMLFISVLLLVIILPVFAMAGIPQLMNFQGILKDSNGDPVVDDIYYIRFRIYDYSESGNVLWESDNGGEVYVPVQVTDGLYNYLLGSHNSLPDSIADYDSLWLGAKIGPGEPEMTPLIELVSVSFAFKALNADEAETAKHADTASYADTTGYAFHALKADTSGYALLISDNSVTSAKIQDGTIQCADIGQNGADSGQVMKFDGTTWSVADDEGASGFFPAPAWESGWIHTAYGGVSLNHNLGQDPDKYFIDMQFKDVDGGWGVCNVGFGLFKQPNDDMWGAAYRFLDSNSIGIYKASSDPVCDYIRVRIWIVQ